MEIILERGARVERRLDPRAEIVARVDCDVGGRSDQVIAYDLSADGCVLQCPLGFVEPGDAIEMRFPRGVLVQGQVIWCQRLNAGVRFSSRVPDSMIAELTLRELGTTSLGQREPCLPPVTHRSRLTPRRPFDPPAG
jgi:hypothetical protein